LDCSRIDDYLKFIYSLSIFKSFKDRLKINLKGLSEENALNLLTFEMFKIMTWNFEDYLKTLDLKPKNEKNLKCANEKHSSFHI
jgi:hypothetical protein